MSLIKQRLWFRKSAQIKQGIYEKFSKINLQKFSIFQKIIRNLYPLADTDNGDKVVKDGVSFLTEKDCSIGLMLTYLRKTVKNLTSGDIFKHLKIIIKSLRNENSDTKESTPFDGDGFKFTSAHISGREGPTKSELIAHYDNEWTKNTKLFDSTKRGFQTVTFPKSGYYEITAAGAGRPSIGYGRGAVITGKVKIEKSQKIVIAIGQMGGNQYAGSGGTFVAKQTDDQCTPLVIAGGCGGSNSDYFIKQPKSHFLILKA